MYIKKPDRVTRILEVSKTLFIGAEKPWWQQWGARIKWRGGNRRRDGGEQDEVKRKNSTQRASQKEASICGDRIWARDRTGSEKQGYIRIKLTVIPQKKSWNSLKTSVFKNQCFSKHAYVHRNACQQKVSLVCTVHILWLVSCLCYY